MFPSKNTHALICFSSTIDENIDTVHLIEGFVFWWNIREWEENNGLINFNWALIRRKKAREIKDTRQRHKL